MLPFDESIPSLINEGISVDTATINKLDTQFKFPSGHHWFYLDPEVDVPIDIMRFYGLQKRDWQN